MKTKDFMCIESPLVLDCLKESEGTIENLAASATNKVKGTLSDVVGKTLLPLIGISFLVDYFNNDSLVRTVKC